MNGRDSWGDDEFDDAMSSSDDSFDGALDFGIEGLHDIDSWNVAPPEPDDRLWRHPSEVAAANLGAREPVLAHAGSATAAPGRQLTVGSFIAPAIVLVALSAIWVGASMMPSPNRSFPTATSIPGVLQLRLTGGGRSAEVMGVVDPSGLTAVLPAPTSFEGVVECVDENNRPLHVVRYDDLMVAVLSEPMSPAHQTATSIPLGASVRSYPSDTEFEYVLVAGSPAVRLVDTSSQSRPGEPLHVGGMFIGWRGDQLDAETYAITPL